MRKFTISAVSLLIGFGLPQFAAAGTQEDTVAVPVSADPAQTPPTRPGHLIQAAYSNHLAPSKFRIIRYDSERNLVERGQWVVKKRTPQYRIRYGALPEGGRPSIRLPFVLYSRVAGQEHECRSGWIKRTIYRGVSSDEKNPCLMDLRDAPVLAGVLTLLGKHGEKLAQLRKYISTLNPDATGPSFEFWFHPVLWEDHRFHKMALETIRAPAA